MATSYELKHFPQRIYICYLQESLQLRQRVLAIVPTLEDARAIAKRHNDSMFHVYWSECAVDCGKNSSWRQVHGEPVIVAFSPGYSMEEGACPGGEEPVDVRTFLDRNTAVNYLRWFDRNLSPEFWEHEFWEVELGWEASGLKELMKSWQE